MTLNLKYSSYSYFMGFSAIRKLLYLPKTTGNIQYIAFKEFTAR